MKRAILLLLVLLALPRHQPPGHHGRAARGVPWRLGDGGHAPQQPQPQRRGSTAPASTPTTLATPRSPSSSTGRSPNRGQALGGGRHLVPRGVADLPRTRCRASARLAPRAPSHRDAAQPRGTGRPARPGARGSSAEQPNRPAVRAQVAPSFSRAIPPRRCRSEAPQPQASQDSARPEEGVPGEPPQHQQNRCRARCAFARRSAVRGRAVGIERSNWPAHRCEPGKEIPQDPLGAKGREEPCAHQPRCSADRGDRTRAEPGCPHSVAAVRMENQRAENTEERGAQLSCLPRPAPAAPRTRAVCRLSAARTPPG